MVSLTTIRYTKKQYKIWRRSFFKALNSLYKKKEISRNDYYKLKREVNEGLKEYG